MKLHLVALPHVQLGTPLTCGCAYSAKNQKFVKMMGPRHEIYLYAPEGPELLDSKFVSCLTNAERIATFGADDPARLPDWPTDAQTAMFNLNVIAALKENATKDDLVLLSGGRTHLPITRALPELRYCEFTVGYEGVIWGHIFAAFESYAWMHYLYGKFGVTDGRWFDRVIPPYYDPAEFPKTNDGKGEYLAFLGRRIERKGLRAAAEIAKAAGMPLLVAGAGDLKVDGDVKYLGPMNVEQRARFLAGAKALLVPTYYVEPGGNVAIEAQAAGTPVISTDWGVFTETVENGVTGFRARMLRDAVAAIEALDDLDPTVIRARAESRYSIGAIAPKFDSWFEDLQELQARGWYAPV